MSLNINKAQPWVFLTVDVTTICFRKFLFMAKSCMKRQEKRNKLNLPDVNCIVFVDGRYAYNNIFTGLGQ